MLPGVYNLNLYRGDTGHWQFKLWTDSAKTQPANLTGVTVEAMIRDKAINGNVALSLGCVVTPPNIIDMTLTEVQSRALPSTGVWDLQLNYSGGDIVTPLAGKVAVTQDVTYVTAMTRKLAAIK